MIKQYLNLTILLIAAWTVYSYCQNDTILPPVAGCIIVFSLLPRLTSAERQFIFFEHIPLSVIIIGSLIVGWIWGSIIPAPETAGSHIPFLISAVQSGTIFATLLIYLKPFTKRNLYYLTFCAWLLVAVSINVRFTGTMTLVFNFFCILSIAVIILNTTKKPPKKIHLFRYYRDFFLLSALLVLMSTGLFYGISRSIVLIDNLFMNIISEYIMPRQYTHFLQMSPHLNLGSPGQSAWDRRPILEVTIPRVKEIYLKTQVFEEYKNGTWIESENIRQTYLPNTFKSKWTQGKMTMFRTFKEIIPTPSKIAAARGNAFYTKSENGIIHADDDQRTRIFEFALSVYDIPAELTPDILNRYTYLSPDIAPQLKELAKAIVGNETDPAAKADHIRSFFNNNFKYSLNVEFKGNNEGILSMIREKRAAYCTYFASAMTLLLRAEGIPSRVAAGFLITENINKRKNTFLARVNNAHAWTEVLLPDMERSVIHPTPYTWKTFDPTPSVELNRTLAKGGFNFSKLRENIWLSMLRFNAYMENADKEKLKKNFLTVLILIMVLINHKKILTGLRKLYPPLSRKVTIRIKKPNKLRSIYRRYEQYLKSAFNEKRQNSDTDRDVIGRLKERKDIPGETIAKVESFLGHYHDARFGEKKHVRLKEIIKSMRRK